MAYVRWRNVFYLFCAIFLVIFIYLVTYEKGGQWVTLLAAVISLLASRFDDVVKFKFSKSGVESEMREVLQEARATVSQLHLLAGELSKIILWTMQAQGRWGGNPKSQNEMRDKVIETLANLGVDKEKISEVVSVEHPYIDFDYAAYVTRPLHREVHGDNLQKWNEFFSPDKRKGIGYEPKPNELEDFLKSVNLFSDDVKERLEDYRYFLKNRKHRRPNEWDKRFEQG